MSPGLQHFSILIGAIVTAITGFVILGKAYTQKHVAACILPECKEKFNGVSGRLNAVEGGSRKINADLDVMESKFSSHEMSTGLRLKELESDNGHMQKDLAEIKNTMGKLDHNIILVMAKLDIPE